MKRQRLLHQSYIKPLFKRVKILQESIMRLKIRLEEILISLKNDGVKIMINLDSRTVLIV
jgi:hypothetical protein